MCEALGRLSEFGIVEPRLNHTAVVRHLGPEELVHFHQVREALEGLAAELAFERLTAEDFARPDALVDATGDPQAPSDLAAFNAFDLDLPCIVATRSDTPNLAHEIVKRLSLTPMIHGPLELTPILRGRLIPRDRCGFTCLVSMDTWNRRFVELADHRRAGGPCSTRSGSIASSKSP